VVKQVSSTFFRFVTGYGILVLAHLILSQVSNIEVLGLFVAVPFLAVYLFSNVGIPGLCLKTAPAGAQWCLWLGVVLSNPLGLSLVSDFLGASVGLRVMADCTGLNAEKGG